MVSGVELYNVVRCFHGDGPACQLEAGQQKGGDFHCWVCPVTINRCTDIPYVYYQQILGLNERINKVLSSNANINKEKLNNLQMFTKLKKHEIELELNQRNVKYSTDNKIDVYKLKLKNEMHGIQCLPALFFNEWENTDMLSHMRYCHVNDSMILRYILLTYEEIVYHASNEKERSLLKIFGMQERGRLSGQFNQSSNLAEE